MSRRIDFSKTPIRVPRTNYFPNRVVAFNSIAGLISTLINVYSQQGGRYSITAKVTVVVTGSCAVVTAVLFLLYNFCILELVKRKHSEEVGVIVEK